MAKDWKWLTLKFAPRRLVEAMSLAVGMVACGTSGLAQMAMDTGAVEETYQQDMPREEWREHVRQAKRRAKAAAVERAKNPELHIQPPPKDPERIATDRILKDDSLQYGDIVSTKNGLFVFRGRGDRERRDDDFVALSKR